MSWHSWQMLIGASGTVTTVAWVLCAYILENLNRLGILDPEKRSVRAMRWIFHEVKPLFRAIAVIRCVVFCIPLTPLDFINALILIQDFWYYERFKNADDDDRWKRRKRKVLEKIEIVNGHLAITPA